MGPVGFGTVRINDLNRERGDSWIPEQGGTAEWRG